MLYAIIGIIATLSFFSFIAYSLGYSAGKSDSQLSDGITRYLRNNDGKDLARLSRENTTLRSVNYELLGRWVAPNMREQAEKQMRDYYDKKEMNLYGGEHKPKDGGNGG